MKKGNWRILSLMLAVLILVMTGCGNIGKSNGRLSGVSGEKTEKEENQDVVEISGIDENAKGRFVETNVELPEEVTAVCDMEKLSDGRLAFFDRVYGLYISDDGGKSLSHQKLSVMEELLQREVYVSAADIGQDGSVLMECWESEEETGESFSYCIYVDAQGNVAKFVPDESETYFTQYLVTSDGRLLGAGLGVYVLDAAQGTAKILCDTRHAVLYMKEIGDFHYLIESDGMEIYNMITGEYEEDSVLHEFLSGESRNLESGSTENYAVMMCSGDTENSLYIATSQGLYRHVVKGSVMEEVIKGSLSSMGSPSYAFNGMAFVDKENFLICYNGRELKQYQYDPDISAVPESELSVYSLRENAAVREAINLYQQANPNTYIIYEIGMTGKDGVTREDAVRNLNTALLSGEGPDILVLDGLPIKSYTEKGILADLSEEINAKCTSGELYENIVGSFKNENGVFAVPAFFTFSIRTGENADGITDLYALADRVEQLREEYPQGNIIGAYREKEVLMRLYDISSPGFVKENGAIDREMLVEYLTCAKRIWQAESRDLDVDKAKTMEKNDESIIEITGKDNWYGNISNLCMDLMAGELRLLFGELDSMSEDYAMLLSVYRTMNQEPNVALLSGLSGNVYIPNTILGVNGAGNQKEAAKEFVMYMLSGELQRKWKGNGFPVNREAMQEIFYEKTSEESVYSLCMSGEDGIILDLEVVWPEDQQIKCLEEMIESLDTPADLDGNVKAAVMELGVSALNGERSVDEAADEIINKVQIYLSE